MEANEARRFVVLDFYRFVAALGVFIFHLKTIDSGIAPIWNGSYGLFVDMFFILSGFVISYSYPSDARGLKAYSRFMIRRIARIYPLHFLTLLVFVLLIGFGLDRSARSTPLDFLYNLVLLQAWGVTDHLSFNSPSWSISAEFFCYLIFPLLMLLARKVHPLVLAAIVAALYLVLAHGHLPIWQERSQMYGANYDYGMLRALPSFLNGILLAILFRLSHPYRHKPVVFAGIALFGISVLVLNIFAKPDLAIILFSCAILLTAVGESAFVQIPGSRLLGRLGNTSYSIYMLHDAVLIAVFKPLWASLGLRPDQFGLFALACCAILTIIADRTYAYFENPARRLINRGADIGFGSPRKVQSSAKTPATNKTSGTKTSVRFDETEQAAN
ncbi:MULTISPECIES: acyltransferase [unclassified Bradyrhizobium]|uniref:acyltransferase family protein n=1 Tax=unclassified Bradyrhizobium TaxID=2631580 RepID=UPI001FFAB158|nr:MULTISPECIES: acyltransferase [unclassified Bradyrhizobium]MCK1269106.1 acyltransferase [Bradyrhizobium sp. 84]MCK1314076.1 acyltransferase [Bradyrhizobium sp. 23]MCK1332994.1 acyltransferase [Bradyrhizobium sp. CW9]MCK1353404.1 acyltransferase [Bradyrhizobium sp. CW7]MCK1373702.1 acyltransferase [Bradyrhizobium sp. 49]